ncbi:MAG: hypothetical protein K0R12_974 [Gammaproteobacteria bacterium]|jgi:Fe-S-cluster containining protein|nr:hypothetical protein [Gammaproteobacteria bacterium]
MTLRLQQHLYPIIDIMVKEAVRDVNDEGSKVSCRKGCDHCCHLLVEISWTEALEMAYWLAEQPESERNHFIARIHDNAKDARELFLQSRRDKQYADRVLDEEAEISEATHDAYFYDKKRPCPFLSTEGVCLAYEVRPSTCRTHVVTSPAELCSAEVSDSDDYDIPERIDDMRDEIAPLNIAVNGDSGWGHLAIMVELALASIQDPSKMLHTPLAASGA